MPMTIKNENYDNVIILTIIMKKIYTDTKLKEYYIKRTTFAEIGFQFFANWCTHFCAL